MPDGEMSFLKFLQAEKNQGRLVVGPAQVYVVCDLQSDTRDVLTSLTEFFRTTPDIFVCMDGITHAPSSPQDQNFDALVQEIGRVVLVTSKWRDMETSVLSYYSVLYEVYCAVRDGSKCKFDLALSLEDCSLINEKAEVKNDIEQRLKTAMTTELTNPELEKARKKIVNRLIDLLSKLNESFINNNQC